LLQVSRWDRLKDMAGVMRGFADHVVPSGDGYLILAGPAVAEVSDDPEGAAVYGECLLQWHDLPAAARSRILLPDPTDLTAFGQAVRLLFADRDKATRLGQAAHTYVREHYLGDIHLLRYAELLGTLMFDDLSAAGPRIN
jgi:hypothetical protein